MGSSSFKEFKKSAQPLVNLLLKMAYYGYVWIDERIQNRIKLIGEDDEPLLPARERRKMIEVDTSKLKEMANKVRLIRGIVKIQYGLSRCYPSAR